jgi:hypothetical protein
VTFHVSADPLQKNARPQRAYLTSPASRPKPSAALLAPEPMPKKRVRSPGESKVTGVSKTSVGEFVARARVIEITCHTNALQAQRNGSYLKSC